MNIEQLALGMHAMAVNWRTELSQADIDLWFQHFQGVDAAVFAEAVDIATGTDDMKFPTVGRMQRHVGAVLREREREQLAIGVPTVEPGDCTHCDAGWVAGKYEFLKGKRYDTVRPCPECNVHMFEEWISRWGPQARHRRRFLGRRPSGHPNDAPTLDDAHQLLADKLAGAGS